MKKILALLLAMMMVFALCACGGGDKAEEPAAPAAPAAAPDAAAPGGAVTWADYQAYLIEKAGSNAPDLEEFKAQVEAMKSWDDIDQSVSPWDQMFTTIGLSTWDEFQAGTVKEPAVMGGPDAAAGGGSSEPSGEPSGEGGAPAGGSAKNTAHGGTAGATSDADYQAYLKAWITAEAEVNTTMTDEQVNGEFIPMIESGNYSDFPVEMMFSGMLNTGAAMTYDEFVAANGVY